MSSALTSRASLPQMWEAASSTIRKLSLGISKSVSTFVSLIRSLSCSEAADTPPHRYPMIQLEHVASRAGAIRTCNLENTAAKWCALDLVTLRGCLGIISAVSDLVSRRLGFSIVLVSGHRDRQTDNEILGAKEQDLYR